MPSTTLVHSFPGSFAGKLGRRGTVALAVAALHVLLAFALVLGLKVSLPQEIKVVLEGVTVPPPKTIVEPPRPPVGPNEVDVTPLTRLYTPPLPDVVTAALDDGPVLTTVTVPTGDVGRGGEGPVVTTAPRVVKSEQPPYPAAARRLGEEGSVVLRVRVDALGRAEIVEVATSSGSPRLDDAAVRSVQRWRFDPARAGTQAVAGWVSLKVTFRLTE
jgi:protein TonB